MGYNLSADLNFDVNKFFHKSDAPVEDVASAISNIKKIYGHKRSLRGTDKYLARFETHVIPEKYFDKNSEKSLQILADFLSKIDKKQKYYYDVDSTNEVFYKLMRTKYFKETVLKGQMLLNRLISFEENYKVFSDAAYNPNYFLAITKEGECRAINVCSVLHTLFDCEISNEIKLAIEVC